MPTKQPEWEFIENLGDRTPLDYGGYFIYRDKTGVYPEEAQLLIVEDEGEKPAYTIYRFPLEQFKMVKGFLVPKSYKTDWPHPLEKYDEWFHRDLGRVSEFVGATTEELEKSFTSEDPLERAEAYRAIGDYHGWNNLDDYPLSGLTREEVENRYKDELRQLKA